MREQDNLFEMILNENEFIEQHNQFVANTGDEDLIRELTILHTDSLDEIKKKRLMAHQKVKYYGYFAPEVPDVTGNQSTPATPALEVAFEYPKGISPVDIVDFDLDDKESITLKNADDDAGLEEDAELLEALTSTERMRRYNRRHPGKVAAYLRRTQKDRVKRNADRKKAVKKYGKSKMSNHDVHHPSGPNGGTWRLAKKDHGRDPKNESVQYLNEGGAAGHMDSVTHDKELTFGEMKDIAHQAMTGKIQDNGPVSEKVDGQNINWTIKDGKIYFDRGGVQMDAEALKKKFTGHKSSGVEQAYISMADELENSMKFLTPKEQTQMFNGGLTWMNTEIIDPATRNVIPYGDKTSLIIHNSVTYDANGNAISHDDDAGNTLVSTLRAKNVPTTKFSIEGPRLVTADDATLLGSKRSAEYYVSAINQVAKSFGLDDNSTISDYTRAWWSAKLDSMAPEGDSWTPEEKKGLIERWAFDEERKARGEPRYNKKELSSDAKKILVDRFEAVKLPTAQQPIWAARKECDRPLDRIFLSMGQEYIGAIKDFTMKTESDEISRSIEYTLQQYIKSVMDGTDDNLKAKLAVETQRLRDVGFENARAMEGVVFYYNGNKYKFTGIFAPINQMMGAKNIELETPDADSDIRWDKFAPNTPNERPMVESETTKRGDIAIIPGRFNSMHKGHKALYDAAVEKYGVDNVYIVTGDVVKDVEPIKKNGKFVLDDEGYKTYTSTPLTFEERARVMTDMFDVPKDKIIKAVGSPWNTKNFEDLIPPGGSYDVISSDKDELTNTAVKIHATVEPVVINGETTSRVISGTDFRRMLGDPINGEEAKRDIFTQAYGQFNEDIFKMLVAAFTRAERALAMQRELDRTGRATGKNLPPEKPTKLEKPTPTPQVTKAPTKTTPIKPLAKPAPIKPSGLIKKTTTKSTLGKPSGGASALDRKPGEPLTKPAGQQKVGGQKGQAKPMPKHPRPTRPEFVSVNGKQMKYYDAVRAYHRLKGSDPKKAALFYDAIKKAGYTSREELK